MPNENQAYDRLTLVILAVTLGLGIVMLYSSSADTARELTGDHMFYLKRQLLRAGLGIGGLIFFLNFDYHNLKRYANHLIVASIALLLLTLLVHEAGGGRGVARWLPLGPISMQTSDLARLALIIFMAAYLDRKGAMITDLTKGFLPPLFMVGAVVALIVVQPDFSTAALTGLLGFLLLFLGGARIKHLAITGAIALPVAVFVLMLQPYRRTRILSFLGLSDSEAASYQISQSLISLGNGGFFGQGLGNSVEKKLFLPAPHTDFVFAIIGEELGFIGAIFLLGLLVILFYRGMVIARNAPDRFGLFLALGILGNFMIYVMVNTGVVTELIPNTGVPLPLISYGGTHIVFTLIGFGILLNISTAVRRINWNRQLAQAWGRL